MNRDSNSYTIIYASVMVILVAVALAFTATALKPRQEQNERIDRMQQILRAINEGEPSISKVTTQYKKYIVKELEINLDGKVLKSFEGNEIGDNAAFNINTEIEFKKIEEYKNNAEQLSKIKLPVFIAKVKDKYYYVLPLNGNGLWDAIWGYLAIDASDHSTVFGSDFGNKGETPGLGAQISTPGFAKRFIGKHIYRDGKFTSIAVVKKGKVSEGSDYVDGISGGTLTSNGVNAMLMTSLQPFDKFLQTYKPAN